MTLIAAVMTGKPLTRKDKTWCYINEMSYFAMRNPTYILPNTFIDPVYFFSIIKISREDVLASDWIVQGGVELTYQTLE